MSCYRDEQGCNWEKSWCRTRKSELRAGGRKRELRAGWGKESSEQGMCESRPWKWDRLQSREKSVQSRERGKFQGRDEETHLCGGSVFGGMFGFSWQGIPRPYSKCTLTPSVCTTILSQKDKCVVWWCVRSWRWCSPVAYLSPPYALRYHSPYLPTHPLHLHHHLHHHLHQHHHQYHQQQHHQQQQHQDHIYRLHMRWNTLLFLLIFLIFNIHRIYKHSHNGNRIQRSDKSCLNWQMQVQIQMQIGKCKCVNCTN